jgi:hypothetical protein
MSLVELEREYTKMRFYSLPAAGRAESYLRYLDKNWNNQYPWMIDSFTFKGKFRRDSLRKSPNSNVLAIL